MAQHGHLTSEEKKIIRQKRRQLRKDLKKRGITSKAEFEIIAQQLGLVYGDGKGLLAWWWRLLGGISPAGLGAIAGVIVAALTVVFGYAFYNTKKEDFTISLTGGLGEIGFDLSETEDFKDPQIRLKAPRANDVHAVSISDIPTDLDNYEGSHNGADYMAYTFWIRNHGKISVGYNWNLVLNKATNGVEDTLWLAIYDEGKHLIYSKAPAGYSNEKLSGYEEYPLYENNAAPNEQFFEGSNGKGVKPRAYVDERIVAKGTVENFEPEEKHKYTVVMWIEGDDPECVNATQGATAQFAFKFSVIVPKEEEEDTFDQIDKESEEEFINQQAEEERRREEERLEQRYYRQGK